MKWLFPKICGSPCNESPTYLGSVLGPLIFGNSQYSLMWPVFGPISPLNEPFKGNLGLFLGNVFELGPLTFGSSQIGV